MPIQKDTPKRIKRTNKEDKKITGYKTGGGKMGAGRSGKEDLGSEKPTHDPSMGSHKPAPESKPKTKKK